MAVAFLAFGIWALWVTRRPRMFLAFAGVFLSVLVWWLCIRPSHDRHWRPEVAVMPRAIVDGDRVRIMGCRNFEYRSRDDFTVRYDERDIVRVRTHFRDEEVYLYRLRVPPENARRLFLVYLDRINELADHAEFYHLLSNSCTINIVRYANV